MGATGFFVSNSKNDKYLITNWHVVTGRSPINPQLSNYNGCIPTSLTFRLHAGNHQSISLSKFNDFEVALNSHEGDRPTWLEHPTHKNSVDIVAIKLDDWEQISEKCSVLTAESWPDADPSIKLSAMDDVFLFGYPWGLKSIGEMPIIKRGNVASEPDLDQNGLPRFLIDCRATPSMSGSIAIHRHSGIYMPNGKMDDATVFGTVESIAGIYSGRLSNAENEESQSGAISEIGIVWRWENVLEIVENGTPGWKL